MPECDLEFVVGYEGKHKYKHSYIIIHFKDKKLF